VDGDVTIRSFTDEKVRDPRILALAEKVEHEPDPDSPYPATYPGWLIIRLRDGTVLEDRQPFNKGSRENPMTEAEIARKYMNNALMKISEEQAAFIRDQIFNIQNIANILDLTRCF